MTPNTSKGMSREQFEKWAAENYIKRPGYEPIKFVMWCEYNNDDNELFIANDCFCYYYKNGENTSGIYWELANKIKEIKLIKRGTPIKKKILLPCPGTRD